MKTRTLGIIAMGILVAIGIIALLPAYFQNSEPVTEEKPVTEAKPVIMLSFLINSDKSDLKWCNELSSILLKQDIEATIFVPGKVAKSYPACVSRFSANPKIDIGSSTYNYTDLTLIPDYVKALEAVRFGKNAVDQAGNLDSKLFKAPYGSTDQNIYSLLNRSGIVADFSYSNKYNKINNGTWMVYNMTGYNPSNGTDIGDVLNKSTAIGEPILVTFDNSMTPIQIDNTISNIKSADSDVQFINASNLTGISLSARE
jgi:peptidoglycan/xylan/chitin deacetylase (PgdA/CDA1 family)